MGPAVLERTLWELFDAPCWSLSAAEGLSANNNYDSGANPDALLLTATADAANAPPNVARPSSAFFCGTSDNEPNLERVFATTTVGAPAVSSGRSQSVATPAVDGQSVARITSTVRIIVVFIAVSAQESLIVEWFTAFSTSAFGTHKVMQMSSSAPTHQQSPKLIWYWRAARGCG